MNVFELLAKIKLDTKEFDSALGGIPSKVGKLSLGIAKGTAKAAGALVAGAAAGVTAITKQAVGAYAQYEQLEGGIKTLYGSNDQAYAQMMANAKKAYTTAGLSMNEYMNTAIESSGAMIKACGDDVVKASKVMDMAIIDMADNANKMGTSMEDIQNAYRGFSRDNYTMLDNLALGYSGTAQGMVELIKDSGILGAEADKLTAKNLKEKVSYDQICEAIHETQVRMGIAGTTSAEAAKTIEGSLRSTKAAWQNVLTTLSSGDTREMGKAVDGLVKAIVGDKKGEGLLNQLKPAITNAIKGIGELITKAAPIIAEQLPILMHEILPPLVDAIKVMLETAIPILAEMLPGLISTLAPVLIDSFITLVSALIKQLPTILASLKDALGKLFYAIVESLNEAFPGLGDMILEIVGKLQQLAPVLIALVSAWGAFKVAMDIADKVKKFKKSAENIYNFFTKFKGALSLIGTKLVAFGGWITGTAVPAIVSFLSAAAPVIGIILGIAAAIAAVVLVIKNWDKILNFLKEFGTAFVEAWSDILSGIWEGLQAWGDTIVEFWAGIFSGIGDKISQAKEAIAQKVEAIKTAISEKWEAIKEAASEKWEAIKTTISDVVEGAKTWLSDTWENIKTTASEKWEGIKQAASEKWNLIKGTITDLVEGAKNAIATKWGEIKQTASEKWDEIKTTIRGKWQAFWDTAKSIGQAIKGGLHDVINKAKQWGLDFMSNLASGIEAGKKWVTDKVTGVAQYMKSQLGHSHPTDGPMKDDYKWMPDMMHLFAGGIYDNMDLLVNASDAMAEALQPDMPEYDAVLPTSTTGAYRAASGDSLAGAGGDIIIPIYLPDGDLWQEIVVNAQNAYNYRSGGR